MSVLASQRFWNIATHGAGVILALVGFYHLALRAAAQPFSVQLLCWFFCAMFVALFSISTRYHMARSEESIRYFNAMDRSAIFFTIAGSCTVLLLIVPGLASDRIIYGWPALRISIGAVWALALLGTLREFKLGKSLAWMSMVLYGLQGVAMLLSINYARLIEFCPLLVLAGVVVYLVGVLWFFRQEHKPYYHAIWHLLVLCGSSLHFAALWFCMA